MAVHMATARRCRGPGLVRPIVFADARRSYPEVATMTLVNVVGEGDLIHRSFRREQDQFLRLIDWKVSSWQLDLAGFIHPAGIEGGTTFLRWGRV
jgi:hypothetical protein